METKPGKRIVSKRAYVKAQGQKVGASTFGLLLLFVGFIGLLTIGIVLPSTTSVLAGLLVFGGVGGASLYLGYLGGRTMKEARQIDPGVPLTRANTADLPAPDSLVRASSEPMQAQETVLLRAAEAGQERHKEQLLRAVTGNDD